MVRRWILLHRFMNFPFAPKTYTHILTLWLPVFSNFLLAYTGTCVCVCVLLMCIAWKTILGRKQFRECHFTVKLVLSSSCRSSNLAYFDIEYFLPWKYHFGGLLINEKERKKKIERDWIEIALQQIS